MTTKEQTKHDIVHWSVIKHVSQHEDLVILTKPRKQHYNIHGGWYGILRKSIPSL